MFLDPRKDIAKHGDKLPHWQQGEAMQFVTFRLADSMPKIKLRQWREQRTAWLRWNPEPWDDKTTAEYHRLFTRKLEDWLDKGEGSCLFREEKNREILREILMKDHGTKAKHEAFVLMPNHAHLLFSPKAPLERLMQVWKGISARKIGKGRIWQPNYRDTLVRDPRHYAKAVRYIRRNPAKLPRGTYTLWEGERARRVP